jgi:hypothetical protein
MTFGEGSSKSLNVTIEKEKVINPFWHLKSIQELKKVRNKYDHILWGELEDGYCEEADANCKCKMQSIVYCCTLRDIMHGHWLDVCKVILGFFKHCFGHVIIGI